MAGLADDWPENRQICVDVLCAYLRMPYQPDPGGEATEPEQLAFRTSREVRHTVIRVITAHLKDDAAVSWQGLNFDFWGVVFDGGNFRNAKFSGGRVDFYGAEFLDSTIDFDNAEFSGGLVSFNGEVFGGGIVSFGYAEFSGGTIELGVVLSDGVCNFRRAEFSGSKIDFGGAEFSGSEVDFSNPNDWSIPPSFSWADAPPPGVKLPQNKINPRRNL
jgi:hypothetical protein